MTETRSDLISLLLRVAVALALAAGTFLTLLPFLGPLIWAATIVVATWPLLLRVERVLWGRRKAAAAVMMALLLGVLIVPLTIAIDAIVSNADAGLQWGRRLASAGLPPAPAWVARLPVVGERLGEAWNGLAAQGQTGLFERAAPYLADAGQWLASQAGSFAGLLVAFLMTVVISGILYVNGEQAAAGVLALARRLSPEQGEAAAWLAARATRSVAIGIVVTALAQAILAGVGMLVAGVPLAPVLTAVVLALCLMQLGPVFVTLPAAGWLFWTGHPGWGGFMIVWSVAVGVLDNFLRPALIRRGADIPFLLVFAGVLGGLLAFGPLGLFVGPIVLAVTYELLRAWVQEDPREAASEPEQAEQAELGCDG